MMVLDLFAATSALVMTSCLFCSAFPLATAGVAAYVSLSLLIVHPCIIGVFVVKCRNSEA